LVSIANDDVIDKLAYLSYIGVSGGSNLVYRAADQPTSGSLSIWFVGGKYERGDKMGFRGLKGTQFVEHDLVDKVREYFNTNISIMTRFPMLI